MPWTDKWQPSLKTPGKKPTCSSGWISQIYWFYFVQVFDISMYTMDLLLEGRQVGEGLPAPRSLSIADLTELDTSRLTTLTENNALSTICETVTYFVGTVPRSLGIRHLRSFFLHRRNWRKRRDPRTCTLQVFTSAQTVFKIPRLTGTLVHMNTSWNSLVDGL